MTSSTILDVTRPTAWAVKGSGVSLHSGLWAGGHHRWEAAGYLAAGLIVLALVPALFVAVDHGVIVQWSNEVLDLVSAR